MFLPTFVFEIAHDEMNTKWKEKQYLTPDIRTDEAFIFVDVEIGAEIETEPHGAPT